MLQSDEMSVKVNVYLRLLLTAGSHIKWTLQLQTIPVILGCFSGLSVFLYYRFMFEYHTFFKKIET